MDTIFLKRGSIPWSRKQLISEENWYHVRIIVPCSEIFIDTTFAPWPQLSKDVSAYSLLGTYNRKGTWLLAQVILSWMTKTSNMIIAICFDRYYGPKLNITKPFHYKLVWKKNAMCMILHCTLMNIVVDSFPQVLFAMHLYSPLWFLLMRMIVSSFSLVTWPVLTFFQETFRGGVPAVTLHSFVTFLPSSTITSCICSTVVGTGRDEREKGVFW